jgi:hypothetical protein
MVVTASAEALRQRAQDRIERGALDAVEVPRALGNNNDPKLGSDLLARAGDQLATELIPRARSCPEPTTLFR